MIETSFDIPVPGRHANSFKEKLRKLEVGESMLVTDRSVQSIRVTISHLHKEGVKRFTTRTVEGGLRVWRTA